MRCRATTPASKPRSPERTARRLRSIRRDRRCSATIFASAPGDYAELFDAAIAERMVRRAGRPGARVRIFGPLEARLQTSTASCSAAWSKASGRRRRAPIPGSAAPDAARSSGSICRNGAIGLSAHDFAQALGAQRSDPHPCREARRRADRGVALRAAARGGRGRDALEGGAGARRAISRLGARLDRADEGDSHRAPAPKPPLDARPTRLSVTEIEHWLRDPYTIYAKHILQARAARRRRHAARRARPRHRDPRRDRRLHRDYAKALPADPLAELLALGEKHFAPLRGLSGGARVLVAALRAHRALVRRLGDGRGARMPRRCTPKCGQSSRSRSTSACSADGARRPHRAARATAAYAMLDYKTGQPPTEKQVRAGLSPQLTLEGAILRAGGFKDVGGRARSASSPMWRCAAASRRARKSRSISRTAYAGSACRHGALDS